MIFVSGAALKFEQFSQDSDLEKALVPRVGVDVGKTDGLGLILALGEGFGVTVAFASGVGEKVGEGEIVGDGLIEGVGLIVAFTEGLMIGEVLAEGIADTVGLPVSEVANANSSEELQRIWSQLRT